MKRLSVQIGKREEQLSHDPTLQYAFRSWWHVVSKRVFRQTNDHTADPSTPAASTSCGGGGRNRGKADGVSFSARPSSWIDIPWISSYIYSLTTFDMHEAIMRRLGIARKRHILERSRFEHIYFTKKARNHRLMYVRYAPSSF